MRRWVGDCAILLSLLSGARVSLAQTQPLRGTARDSATSAPLPGVVLTAIDSSGSTVGRTIADAAGRFSLPLLPSTARIHVVRIGYRPRDFARPPGAASLDFTMSRIPPLLDAVRVSDRELCPGSADRGAAFQLWEQARAGLLASVVARDANPATVTTTVFERRMLPGDDLVRRQQIERHTGETTRPFVAFAAPARFAAQGYLREVGNDRLFLAPDADVLLDESFVATHCFHLQAADAGHADQIGLAFVPVPNHSDTLVDVSGVIWIDRVDPMLRSFDFRYTNLEPAAVRAGAGGHLDFRTVANGVSFVEWWSLRLPVLTMTPRPPSATASQFPRPRLRQDRRDFQVGEIHEGGGQVLQAKWPDGTNWQAAPTGITGAVTERGSAHALVGALVTLSGTQDTLTTDERGQFTLPAMVPGRYTVVIADTSLGAFTPARSETRVVEVRRGQTVEVRVDLLPALESIRQSCRKQRELPYTTTIVGRVVLPDGGPAQRGVVRAVWQADYGQVREAISVTTTERSMDLDAEGRFLLCGVAAERPIHLLLIDPSGVADTTVRTYDTLLKAIEWRPTPRRP
jgi:hypothetical protein